MRKKTITLKKETTLTWREVCEAFYKAAKNPKKCDVAFWVGPNGIFHDNWDKYKKADDAVTCTCGISYSAKYKTWTVTPWLFFADCPAVFKTFESAQHMFFFWLNWMDMLYGDDPDFEKDWLAVKSNRSVLEILFDQEGERLKEKLYKSEESFIDGNFNGYGKLTLANGDVYEGDFVDGKPSGKGKLLWVDGFVYEGDFVNGKRTGKGKIMFEDGSVFYEGDFVDDKFHGKGKMTFPDDKVYEGDFVEGYFHGKGKIKYVNGNIYEGDIVQDEPHGKGKMTFTDGDMYEGDFVNGEYHGKGKYTYASGSVYEGDYDHNKHTGKGKFTYSNGHIYEGDFVNDKEHGKGKMTYIQGGIYEGDYVDGTWHGTGKYYYENGDVYEGSFVKGNPQGKAKITYANGDVYEGDYAKHARHGRGKYTFTNGDIYEGGFFYDNRRGKGKYVFSNGDIYEGSFLLNNFHGRGKYTYANGDIYKGRFIDGDAAGKTEHTFSVVGVMYDDEFEISRRELKRLNLKTPDDFEGLLKPLIKDAAKLTLKRREQMPEGTNLKSHFGGQPYFEKGEQWPKAKNGNYMELLFQVFNTGNIGLPENIKLLQFYYDFEERPWFTKDDGWLVKIYAHINTDNVAIIEKPEELDRGTYCEIEFKPIKSLPQWHELDYYDKKVETLASMLEKGGGSKGYYYKVVKKFNGELDMCSQLGGYAHWLQSVDRPEDKDFQLLFQIDSEDEAGLMWSDCGLIYVYYNPKTGETTFELQCC